MDEIQKRKLLEELQQGHKDDVRRMMGEDPWKSERSLAAIVTEAKNKQQETAEPQQQETQPFDPASFEMLVGPTIEPDAKFQAETEALEQGVVDLLAEALESTRTAPEEEEESPPEEPISQEPPADTTDELTDFASPQPPPPDETDPFQQAAQQRAETVQDAGRQIKRQERKEEKERVVHAKQQIEAQRQKTPSEIRGKARRDAAEEKRAFRERWGKDPTFRETIRQQMAEGRSQTLYAQPSIGARAGFDDALRSQYGSSNAGSQFAAATAVTAEALGDAYLNAARRLIEVERIVRDAVT